MNIINVIKPLRKISYKKSLSLAILSAGIMSTAHAKDTNLPYKGLLVSSKSLLLLANEATKGIEQPKRIFKGREVGHHQEITPSARKLMKEAELIFWYGDEIEAGLAKTLADKKNALALLEVKAFDLYKPRPLHPTSNGHETHKKHDHDEHKHHGNHGHDEHKHHDEHGHDEHKHHEHEHHHTNDPHIWLDPIRAIRIVNAITEGRAYQYPKLATKYRQNADNFRVKMLALANKNKRSKTIPYIAFHDAYRYAEKTLNVKHIASLTKEPDHPIKPSQMKYVLQLLQKNPNQKVCFFSESLNVAKKAPKLVPYLTVVNIDPKLNNYDSYIDAWADFNKQLKKCAK